MSLIVKRRNKMINIFQPCLDESDVNSIQDVIKTNWIGKGKKVKEFEEKFSKLQNADPELFLSTTSCTEAIFLATQIFNFGEGDEIIVPSISFPSIGSAILESKATIVFCDVNTDTLNVEAKNIANLINDNTKAIFITHYGGIPVDVDEIKKVFNKQDIKIIEDSACAIHSTYKGKACGTLGDMGFWSFDAMKTLTTGDGGMMFFKDKNDKNTASEMLYLGLPQDEKTGLDKSGNNKPWWEYELVRPGRRAIMNDITAAIGVNQIEKVPGYISRRNEIHGLYQSGLKNIEGLILPSEIDSHSKSSYYFYTIKTSYRDELAKFLLEHDIYSTFRYWPLHKMKLFNSFNSVLPATEQLSRTALNIPLHQSLSDDEVNYIIKTIRQFFIERP